MNIFSIIGYACWVASALLVLWMLVDFFKTNSQFGEDFLLSSKEGHDEITEQEKMFATEREQDKKQ